MNPAVVMENTDCNNLRYSPINESGTYTGFWPGETGHYNPTCYMDVTM